MKSALLAAMGFAFAAGSAAAQTPHRFETLDVNRDGRLTKPELIGALPGIAAGFDIADRNNDGFLSRAEFDEAIALSASMYGEGAASAQKREMFRALDADGDRAISGSEAQARPAIAADFQAADRNADGRLGPSEFGLVSVYTLALRRPEARSWNAEAIYPDGMSAAEMIDKPVRGERGEAIGEVHDIVVGRDGRIERLVVEVGGFFEVGDQHIGVPWKDVKIGENMRFVQVPLKEVESGTYSLFGRVPQGEKVPTTELTSWRVTELIGDYASLADVPRYGIVNDVIFDSTGRARAVVVRRGPAWGGYGLYAYPYDGYYETAVVYPLPYRKDAVAAMPAFDYRKLGEQSRYAGTENPARQAQGTAQPASAGR